MELIMQPTARSCGQTCVAMICGIRWFAAVDAVGHMRTTRTREIVSALRKLGKDVDPHLTVRKRRAELPTDGTYLVKLRYPKTWRAHWAVLHEGQIYDPAHGMNPSMEPGWRYTSMLKVR